MSGLEDAMLHFLFISPAVSGTFGIISLLSELASAELACRELLFALTMVETDYTGPF